MQTLHHKRNEKKEIEFFQDKECTIPFDFTNAKKLYIDLKDGDITPLYILKDKYYWRNVYTPYMSHKFSCEPCDNVKTLDDIKPNLSKYIPEDNAVLFLNGEKISLIDYDTYYNMFDGYRDIEFEGKIIKGMPYHPQIYGIHRIRDMVYIHKHEYDIDDYTNFSLNILKGKKITIFLKHGTKAELQKAEEVAKELKEKYGIDEVNLFVLYWFGSEYQENDFEIEYLCKDFGVLSNFNKIITTNSTGILEPQNNERLQVIDCKEIFDEYLKNN